MMLNRPHGPVPESVHDMPRPDWPEMTQPSPERMAQWVDLLTVEQLQVWLERAGLIRDQESQCFMRDHDRQIEELQRTINRLHERLALAERHGTASLGDRFVDSPGFRRVTAKLQDEVDGRVAGRRRKVEEPQRRSRIVFR